MIKYVIIILAGAAVGLCGGYGGEYAWSQYESRDRERPQTPKPPYPYANEDVVLTAKDGVKLAGTLTIPAGQGPFPAIVLLNVAGPNDRNMSFRGHRTMQVLADRLTRIGFATVRFDDRGQGASTGDLFKASYDDLTDDALAAVAMLKAKPQIAPDKIGVAGMSEGGAISAMAASRSSGVNFAVLMSAPGLQGEAALRSSLEASIRHFGVGREAADMLRKQFGQFVGLARRAGSDPKALADLAAFLEGEGRQLIPPYGFLPKDPSSLARVLSGPWYVSQLDYDPSKYFPKIACPVLAIGGSKDMVLPPREHLTAIESLLRQSPSTQVMVAELPGLNHILQTARTGLPSEYAKTEETISPDALNKIEEWLKANVLAVR